MLAFIMVMQIKSLVASAKFELHFPYVYPNYQQYKHHFVYAIPRTHQVKRGSKTLWLEFLNIQYRQR